MLSPSWSDGCSAPLQQQPCQTETRRRSLLTAGFPRYWSPDVNVPVWLFGEHPKCRRTLGRWRSAGRARAPPRQDARHQPAKRGVGNDRQGRRDDQRLKGIEEVQHQELIDAVEQKRDPEQRTDVAPPAGQRAAPVPARGQEQPEERRTA